MLKNFKIALLFLYFFAHQICIYGDNPTPSLDFFKSFFQNSLVGFSCGPKITSFNHVLKSDIAKAAVIDNTLYFLQTFPKYNLPQNQQLPDTSFVYQFNWPKDTFYMIFPNESFLNSLKAETAKQKIQVSPNKTKYLDANIKGLNFSIPFHLSYLYEFPNKLVRIGLEPTFIITRTSNFKISTVANKNGSKTLGTAKPLNSISYQYQLPLSFYFKVFKNELVDLFVCFLGGLEFSSLSFKEQNFYSIFWEAGINLEHSFKNNFKPFCKISLSKSSFPDTRIRNPVTDLIGLIYNHFSINLEVGVRFRILPDLPRCYISGCKIKYNHIHGRKNYRGKSYFNS